MGWDGLGLPMQGGPAPQAPRCGGQHSLSSINFSHAPRFPAPHPARHSAAHGTMCHGATSALQIDGVTLCAA